MAHNLKGYDGCFILQHILANKTPRDGKHTVLTVGSKILCIKFRKLKIIDSYSFLPVSLSKLPKMFGITELKKGYFPHAFNLPENLAYDGPYPDKKLYGSEFFSCSAKQEFDTWYDDKVQKQERFNFKYEIEAYCLSDVKLLSAAVMAFRVIIMNMTKKSEADPGLDPFRKSITLPSLCHVIYRRNMMPSKSIAITPENGFDPNKLTSRKCQQWLKYLAESQNLHIQHSNNGGEQKVGNYYLDGICKENKTIFEFNGCIWHGCPTCFKSSTFSSLKQLTMGSLYSHHKKRLALIQEKMPGYTVVEMWECQWDKLVKNSAEVKTHMLRYPVIPDPLKPRDALYGGRTNAIVLHYICGPGEKIMYQDYTSLYPDVQKNGVFPAGKVQVITENFKHVSEYFGLIHCKMRPPRRLYMPVLPSRINGKLVFALCSKCAAEENQAPCTHNNEERALTGTWVTLEVNKAIEMGYQVEQIYEVWHYNKRHQNDPVTKQGGLFTDYVNKFVKFKTEASGYPHHIITDEAKVAFIEEYYEKEGIHLDPASMISNPGLRTVSKLLCNSFWGRYGK